MTERIAPFFSTVWVVSGRAVHAAPSGVLVERAPKGAARSREQDTVAVLLSAAGSAQPPAAFFEELARLASDVYFGSGGSVTGGLREALLALNAKLRAENPPRPVHALMLALHGDTLYAARSGEAFLALLQWPNLVTFPPDRRDPLALSLRPLGSAPEPDIDFARYTVAPNQTALLADPGLAQCLDGELRTALSAENVAGMAARLKALAGSRTVACVLRFLSPEAPDPSGQRPVSSERAPHPAPSVLPPTETPTPELPSIAAPPPVSPAPPSEPPATVPASVAPEPPQTSPSVETETSAPASAKEAAALAETPKRPAFPRAPKLHRPAIFPRAAEQIRGAGRAIVRGVLAVLLAVVTFFSAILERLIPTPEDEGGQNIPTNIAVGMAVVIPLVIVIVVVGLTLSNQGKGEFQYTLDRAKTAHEEALTLSGGTCENVALRPLWSEVLRLAEQAGHYRPNDPDVLVISADARNYLDCYDKVERRDVVVLHEFAENAKLIGPVVANGVDLYTLDRANGAIYHDTLNENGDRLTTVGEEPIIWQGQVISGANGTFTVGDLLDIEWLSSGGTAHDNVLIALDRNGLLVAYSPTFFATAQQLVTEGRWVRPTALAVFRTNIYVLDTGANQIWRYVPPAGVRAYSSAPEEYFNGDELPDLHDAVDFGISDEGAVYVLFRDGTVKKYRRNVQAIVEEQPFEYRERPPGALTSGTALFVDNDPLSRQLYILDAENATVYETLWGGKFRRGYRPRNEPDAFADLSGFYADAVVRNNMYALSGNKLYWFARNSP